MNDRGNSYACGNSNPLGNSAYNGPPTTIDGTPVNDWHWWYLV